MVQLDFIWKISISQRPLRLLLRQIMLATSRPESFPKLPKIKSECLLSWICDDEDTDEEILLRSLTLASWKSDKGIKNSLVQLKAKTIRKFDFRILYNNEFTLDLLFEAIDTNEHDP